MLSTVAQFTPFSDFNQSPRNMYQCQVGPSRLGVRAFCQLAAGQRVKYVPKPIIFHKFLVTFMCCFLFYQVALCYKYVFLFKDK